MKGAFHIHEHQHKGSYLLNALEDAGYARWPMPRFPQMAFWDAESGDYGFGFKYELYICRHKEIPVFFYPHTSRPGYPYILRPPWPHAAARFVVSEGSKDIMRAYGVQGNIHVIGWTFSEVRDEFSFFEGKRKPRVLFAPIHPHGNRYLHAIDKKVNTKTMQRLKELKDDFEVRVRWLGTLEDNKIWRESGIEYVHGQPDGSTADIEWADIVIGAYTFAGISIALGKPTIMIGERAIPHSGLMDELILWCESPRIYQRESQFPFNLEDVIESRARVKEMIWMALDENPDVDRWKHEFIGESFDPEKFLSYVEGHTGDMRKQVRDRLKGAVTLKMTPGSASVPKFIPEKRKASQFYLHNHQGKLSALAESLKNHEYRRVTRLAAADFLLTDIDVLGRRKAISKMQELGRPTFLAPHTGRPVLQWDGMYDPHPAVTAVFTFAKGGAMVPRLYGFTQKPIHPIGWWYCDILPFRPCEKPLNVLFAPIHVNGNGFLTEREKNTNVLAYQKLLELVSSQGIKLTVRYLHNLEWNGLWKEEGVKFVKGEPDQSVKEIAAADVMIGHQNMLYLAAASGTPALGIAEYLVPISGSSQHNIRTVESWNKYRDILMFPHDLLTGDPWESILAACEGEESVAQWKELFIGKPYDEDLFLEYLEKYL